VDGPVEEVPPVGAGSTGVRVPAAGVDIESIGEKPGGAPTGVLFPAAEGDVEPMGEKPGGSPVVLDVEERREGPAGGSAEVTGPMSGTRCSGVAGVPNQVRRRGNRSKTRVAGGTCNEER
jgi:hypothetical protein